MSSGPVTHTQRAINANDEIYLELVSEPRSLENSRKTYHPTIVMGCATEKRTLLAMLRRRKRFEISAITSCIAFMAINLENIGTVIDRLDSVNLTFGIR
jgi:hypothetical protein